MHTMHQSPKHSTCLISTLSVHISRVFKIIKKPYQIVTVQWISWNEPSNDITEVKNKMHIRGFSISKKKRRNTLYGYRYLHQVHASSPNQHFLVNRNWNKNKIKYCIFDAIHLKLDWDNGGMSWEPEAVDGWVVVDAAAIWLGLKAEEGGGYSVRSCVENLLHISLSRLDLSCGSRVVYSENGFNTSTLQTMLCQNFIYGV